MNRVLSLSIRVQLLLLAGLVALPAAGIIVVSGLRLRAEAVRHAGTETRQLADIIAAEERNLVNGAEQVITVLAQLPEVRARDPRVTSVLKALLALNPALSNVFIADRDGRVWASGVTTPGFSIADRRYFVNALRTGRLSSGEYIVSRATARPALNLGYPLRDERGEVAGAVCVGLSLESLRGRLVDAKLENSPNFVLLDHRGVILSRAVDEANFVGKPYHADAFQAMAAGPDSLTFEGPGLLRDRRIITYRKLWLPGEPEPYMYVRVGIPVAKALAQANGALARNLVLFLSFLLLAVALVVRAGKVSIVDRVAALEEASRRVAAGDLAVRVSEVVRGGELGRLGETFDAMAARLASRERALVESERMLLHAQKMESVGRLAGGVAHDFNNMLTVILGEAALIRAGGGDGAAARASADEIARAALRSRDVTRQLLAFSRKQVAAPRVVDLNAVAAELRQALARLIGEDVELVLEPAPGLWPVRLDPAQLDQILVNLVVNARDAMPEGGRITISTDNVEVREPRAPELAGLPPGEYALLAVRDDGAGMDEATLSHLFEPFFTTKGAGKGTGLGLATVYGIVTQNGGFIRAESAPGRGALFRIYLPRTEEAAAREAAAARPADRGHGRVLLVEDEDLVRATARRMLESLGYHVTAVASAAEALSVCARPDVVIDLLLTDVVMPEMKGTELRQRVESIRPGLPTVFMSGYTSDAVMDAAPAGMGFLQKPFSTPELARELRRALG